MSDVVFSGEDDSVETRFISVPPFGRWTFERENIRAWTESKLKGRVLNACAGKTRLSHDSEIVTNDLDPKIDTDLSVDVASLSRHFPESSFDTVLYDPPWSLYQSNLRYDGRHVSKGEMSGAIDMDALPISIDGGHEKSQLGHSRLAKEGFDYLLSENGRVIEFTQHGSCMPSRLGFDRVERVMFDPIGEGKSVIASVDEREDLHDD